jgi:micrococcal nuclease
MSFFRVDFVLLELTRIYFMGKSNAVFAVSWSHLKALAVTVVLIATTILKFDLIAQSVGRGAAREPAMPPRYSFLVLCIALSLAACNGAADASPPTATPAPPIAPTVAVQATPTPTATPAPIPTTVPADHTIVNGGNLRAAPQVAPETVIGQVCPGDQVVVLETQAEWVRVRLITPAADCVDTRAAAGHDGWVSGALIIPQVSRTAGMPAMPAGLTAGIVSNVVDGDTLDVTIGGVEQRIRMLGMDTPETKHPSKPVECFGQEASEQASALLQGQVVLLEADQSQGDADRYGRLLRFVWLPDGRLVNFVLIAEGYAFEYTYNRPHHYQAQFQAAETAAREQQAGLWAASACGGQRKAVTMPATAIPVPSPTPPPTARPANCDPSYPDVCIPSPPPDLDCADVAPLCRFRVLPPDPHQFDLGDGDGLGCERCP